MKFKVGDVVSCDIYEMDGCCHDCEGTAHYLDYDETFTVSAVDEYYVYHINCEFGYLIDDVRLITPLEKALK